MLRPSMLKKEVCGAGGGGNLRRRLRTYFTDRLNAAFSMSSATAFGCET